MATTVPNITGTNATAANVPKPSPSAPLSDYQILLNDIKQSIANNDANFKLLQKTNYPDASVYESDFLNYKIDTQIEDLIKARDEVWNFLTQKYDENSKIRIFYFNEVRKIDKYITELGKEKSELLEKIEGYNIKANTSINVIKTEKYNFNKMGYYLFLYKILVFIQIAMLAIITLCILEIIPKATGLIIIIIILIATLAFVGYYVFFVNIGRNQFSWAKFNHDNNVNLKSNQCSDDNQVSAADKAKAEADAKINEMIKQNQANKCSS